MNYIARYTIAKEDEILTTICYFYEELKNLEISWQFILKFGLFERRNTYESN